MDNLQEIVAEDLQRWNEITDFDEREGEYESLREI